MSEDNPALRLPLDRHIAILGREESGKTNVLQLFAARILECGWRLCVLDQTDSWWGLRLMADGVTPSPWKSVVIFGGPHGDLPLDPTHGCQLALLAGRRDAPPMIISTGHLTPAERARFHGDFLGAMARLVTGSMHLILDDAELLRVPDAFDLAIAARRRRIHLVISTAFPDSIEHEFLRRTGAIVALRMAHPPSRRMIEATLERMGELASIDIPDSLPGLPIGSGWICQPSAEICERVAFPIAPTWCAAQPMTIDRIAPMPPKIDVSAVREMMAGLHADVAPETDDLHRRVIDAERQALIPRAEAAVVRIEGVRDGARLGFELCRRAVGQHLDKAGISLGGLSQALDQLDADLPAFVHLTGAEPTAWKRRQLDHAAEILGDIERAVLTATVQFPGCSVARAALVIGEKPDSGLIMAAVGILRRRKFLTPGLPLLPTADGVAVLGEDFPLLPAGAAVLRLWTEKLAAFDRLVLFTLLQAAGGMTAVQVRETFEDPTATSGVEAALRNLRQCGLVEWHSSRSVASISPELWAVLALT